MKRQKASSPQALSEILCLFVIVQLDKHISKDYAVKVSMVGDRGRDLETGDGNAGG